MGSDFVKTKPPAQPEGGALERNSIKFLNRMCFFNFIP